MAKLRDILALFDASDDMIIDRSISAALPTADASDMPQLVESLLRRGDPKACETLIERYDCLPERCQSQLLASLPEMVSLLRRALHHPSPDTRRSVIRMIVEGQAWRLCYLLAEQTLDGAVRFRVESAVALRELAREADKRQPVIQPENIQHLITALIDAAQGYGHHQRTEILEAILLLLPRRIQTLEQMLTHEESPLFHGIRQHIARGRCSLVQRALFCLMHYDGLQACCLAALRQIELHRAGTAWLTMSHLHLSPRVASVLSRVIEPQKLIPTESQLSQMKPETLRLWPDVLLKLPLMRSQQVAQLARLSVHSDTSVRLAALRHIIELAETSDRDEVDELAATFLQDDEVHLARLALWHLIRTRSARLPLMLARLVVSPHESIRKMAGERLAPIGFERMWDQWGRLTDDQRDIAGRAMIKIDRQFHRRLSIRLIHDNREHRLKAISIITHLGQSGYYEKALTKLAEHQDLFLASSAIQALGQVETLEARDIVYHALDHHDGRVRANAVEALALPMDETVIAKLVTMWDDKAGRPRANAIGVLLAERLDKAMGALTAMLRDERREHRRSALWLVREARLLELSRLVAEMSVSDHDQEIRESAKQTITMLMQSMRMSNPLGPVQVENKDQAA